MGYASKNIINQNPFEREDFFYLLNMILNQIIEETISFVKHKLANAESGHDWFHIERVYKNAMNIAKDIECDLTVVQLAALLHDIADSKFNDGDETIGPKTAETFLNGLKVDSDVVSHVVKIIENISFKGGNVVKTFSSIELDIVQDADRLDAIGAIGIARAFNYGGFKNRQIFNPEVALNLNMDNETYKHSRAPTINHFYEKLLLLSDQMKTSQAKKIAQERHQFMESFLEQFYNEWNGIK